VDVEAHPAGLTRRFLVDDDEGQVSVGPFNFQPLLGDVACGVVHDDLHRLADEGKCLHLEDGDGCSLRIDHRVVGGMVVARRWRGRWPEQRSVGVTARPEVVVIRWRRRWLWRGEGRGIWQQDLRRLGAGRPGLGRHCYGCARHPGQHSGDQRDGKKSADLHDDPLGMCSALLQGSIHDDEPASGTSRRCAGPPGGQAERRLIE
jgi:hypothetical protein